MTECFPQIVDILLLLDLSPEFDIIDQALLDLLENTAGLDRQGLAWFRSHLTEHFLFVSMTGMQVNRVQ